jgi:hypothetical protein
VIPAPLANAFRVIAASAPPGRDDWWIIGSAAMLLAGVPGVEPDDVDILCSRGTAHGFASGWDAIAIDGRVGERFRSEPYLKTFIPCCSTIEVMAGLEVLVEGQWRRAAPGSRLPVEVEGGTVFIASLADQIAMLRQSGREKDLARAQLAGAFLARP